MNFSLGSSGSFFILFLNWFVSSIVIFSPMHFSLFFISCFHHILCGSGIFIISEWIFLKIHFRLKVWKDHGCGFAERIFKSSNHQFKWTRRAAIRFVCLLIYFAAFATILFFIHQCNRANQTEFNAKKHVKTVNIDLSCEYERIFLLRKSFILSISVRALCTKHLLNEKYIYHPLGKLFQLIRLWNSFVKLHIMYSAQCTHYKPTNISLRSLTFWRTLKAI